MNTPQPLPRKRRSRRFINPYTALLLVLLLVGAGYYGWKRFFDTPDPRDQVLLATVQRGDIDDLVTATGTLQPRDYVDVGAQVSGQLKKIHVEVGSVVAAGDLLAEIDPTVFAATVEGRRASLRNLQATMLDREASLALAQIQYTRQKNLMAENATTTESVQQAEATLKSSRAQIAALQAQIEQAQATLKSDEANLDRARIFAPMSGTVVSITARQGQTLNTNQSAPTVLRIADLSTMTVQTQVSEADISKLRQGMEVYFTTLGSQSRRWYGQLRKVEPTPTVTNNVVLYNALFDVPNANQALMTSMTAQVFFVAASARNVLMVPAAAVSGGRGPGNRQRQGGQGEQGGGSGGGAGGAGMSPGSMAGAASAASAAGAQNLSRVADAGSAAERTAGRDPSRAAAPRERSGPAGANPTSSDNRGNGAAAGAPGPSASMPRGMGNGGGANDPMAGMSREERRAAFERMSPEEREAMRERRRAEREAAGGGAESGAGRPGGFGPGAGVGAGTSTGPGAGAVPNAAGERRPPAGQRAPATAAATPGAASAARLPTQGVQSGLAERSATRAPRRATVKVMDAKGKIEERQVEVGVSNRVQTEILSGLKEGEQVIAGQKQAGNAQQRGNNQPGGPGGPGGMPPGMAPGGLGGAARSR